MSKQATRIVHKTHDTVRDAFAFAMEAQKAGSAVRLSRPPLGKWTTTTMTTLKVVA